MEKLICETDPDLFECKKLSFICMELDPSEGQSLMIASFGVTFIIGIMIFGIVSKMYSKWK